MIQWWRRLFRVPHPEESIQPVTELDLNNIYVRLKMAMDRVNSTRIQLNASPASLGRIHNFSQTMGDFLKSLMEVNKTLDENKHIETGQFFYARNIIEVKFDKFLFVQDGYYVDNAPATLQLVLEQIDVYYEKMKSAHEAEYGVMEHNHRQLYSYTESLVEFLTALLDRFGE